MPPLPEPAPSSMLFVEEAFAAEDAGFIEALRRISSPKLLAAFADRWKADPRPWARQQLLAYLDLPMDRRGHEPIVKRLFKDAEAKKDVQLMGAFLVAFDRSVRRVRRPHWRWDSALRQGVSEDRLATPRNVLPHVGQERKVSSYDYKSGRMVTRMEPVLPPKGGRLFTYGTRYYLRRRAWRFFRWLGYSRPAEFPSAIAHALERYRDEDLEKGENILDSWALLNICFHGSDALIFTPSHVKLAEGHSLRELNAAPRFPHAWETPEAGRVLHGLIVRARSQLVRIWAMEMFERVSARVELSPEELLALLDHSDEQVQQFAARLFETQPGLEKLPITTWLELLRTRNLLALATLTSVFEKHVSGDRLDLPQMIELTKAKPVPVARLGFRYLQARQIAREEYPHLIALAGLQAPALAHEIVAWALARVASAEAYSTDVVTAFFDSIVFETRTAAWQWLVAEESPGARDAVLWSRLAETPFDDLRLKLVDFLATRAQRPDPDQLTPVWSAVLLGVHRGGRQKLKAVRQLADLIAEEPTRAETLLPVLAVAVRSSRETEMRAGLAAVMSLMERRPALAASVRARLPEMSFEGGGA